MGGCFSDEYCTIIHGNPSQGIPLFEIQKFEYF